MKKELSTPQPQEILTLSKGLFEKNIVGTPHTQGLLNTNGEKYFSLQKL